MRKEFLLAVLLGIAQTSLGQVFADPEPNVELGATYDVGSGDSSDVFRAEEIIDDLEYSSCPEGQWGDECEYELFGSESVVPKSQWRDAVPGDRKRCTVFGATRIVTFGGAPVIYHRNCEVLLYMGGVDDDSPKIWLQPSPGDNSISYVRMSKSGEDDVIISDETDVSEVPDKSWDGALTINREGNYVVMEYARIKVRYSVKNSLLILTAPYLSGTNGLCGDMDGNSMNDDRALFEPSLVESRDPTCTDTEQPSLEFNSCIRRTSIRQICNMLMAEPFAGCSSVLDPKPYYKLCLYDACQKIFFSEESLLCDVLGAYSSECALNNGFPGEWRERANCVAKSCENGMEWGECIDQSRTCEAYGNGDTSPTFSMCEEGCQCPAGKYFQDGVCVASKQCKCKMDGELYHPGQKIATACNNTCSCQAGRWDCTNKKCSGVASAEGLFHYVTFDGRSFTYREACTFILAKECDSDDFVVMVSYEEHDGAYYKSIIVGVKEGDRSNIYVLKRDGKIEHNGKSVYPPLKSGLVDIRGMGKTLLFTLVGKNVYITFNGVARVEVEVPWSYAGKMCGLGGNFNGKKSDDFIMRSKFPQEALDKFADDWKWEPSCEKAIPHSNGPTECADATKICQKMKEQTECGSCSEAATLCEKDVCSLYNIKSQVAFACSATRSFLTKCQAKNTMKLFVPADLGEECQQECPDEMQLRESNDCADSCASFSNHCTEEVYLGCFCPVDMYRNAERSCVPRDECQCLYEGTWYETGRVTSIPNQDCTCSGGEMNCNEINETMACTSSGTQYYACDDPYDIQGAACERTCKRMNDLCMAGSCMTGCACKPGLYRDNDDSCVPKEECGCYTGGKYFKHGESFMDDCNTMTCMGGTFTKTDLVCPSTCWAVGASHYKSFDGQRIDVEGDCEYILATDYCPNNPNGGLFSVHIKNTRCGSRGLTCSKSIIVSVKNQKITLERGLDPIIEKIAGTRFRRAITGYTDYSKPDTFTIKQKGIFTVIDTCIGMTVLWDKGTRVYIRLTEEFSGTTCGLCGNFDGSDDNDLILSNGLDNSNVFTFTNSWKFPPSSYCLDTDEAALTNTSCTDEMRREWATEKCGVLTDKAGAFADCHEKIDPKQYFDLCVHDACGCDTGGDCECLCTAIAHYAHLCASKGVPIEWRSNNLCPIMCEQYNDDEDVCLWHYRPCATCITDTCCDCQQPEDTHWCVEGCFPKCPTGYILDEMTQKCITASKRDSRCTWFSSENMCHTCKKCEVCKTPSGALLRIQPGEKRYFPLTTDMCEVEWCAIDTTGDLCYNGTIELYDCKEQFPIPPYDERYYIQTCWNTTKSECENCRECDKECIVRNDSCEAGKTPESENWRKVFPVLPTPERGPKTYCMEYSCEYIPEATDPACTRQTEERVICTQSILDVTCESWERLVIYPTGDECCPEKYECECDVCEFQNGGTIEHVNWIQPGEEQNKCEDESESNCCYTDVCTEREEGVDKRQCPQVTRTQDPCTTGPAPTCSPGFIWRNMTREADCCPWGECECDACYDYDAFNNRILRLIGDIWNKKCMKFKCVRDVRDATGCYQTRNFENVTCSKPPECKEDEHVEVVGIDEWECCDIFDCVCNDQCHTTIRGSKRLIDVGQETQMDDGCWYKCVNPTADEECPRPEKICYPPTDCQECEFIADTVNDTCGCPKYDCQSVPRCPSIDCPFPYVRVVDPNADKCKAPCYDCECKECWDQYQNRTYKVGSTWQRQLLEPVGCENCECTNEEDEDGCLKENCVPKECPPVEECESPYDEATTRLDECGCTVLVGCVCPYCSFNGEVLEDKVPGNSWTVGDVESGCYDTYECLTLKTPGQDKECFNVTKLRNPCPDPPECPEDFVSVKNEDESCNYDDDEHCGKYDCVCVKCRFDGESYDPGDTWTKDCIDYACTDVVDTADQARCKKIESSVVSCPEANLNCTGCYVQKLQQERQVPDHCCNIWNCTAELFCVNEYGERVTNGTIWQPEECKRVQCSVSKEDWAKGICPTAVDIDHCDPDPTECTECQNTTIVKDKCGCDKVECPMNNKPTSCKNPTERQVIEYLNTDDFCYPSKNCCVCDDSCMYKGERRELFSIWWDRSTCQRMRCVPPAATLSILGFENVFVDDSDDIIAKSRKLSYRNMLIDTGISKSLYSECSQDISLCPIAYDIGCPKPVECGECEHTEESVDNCGCPILTCTPYVCPPAPWNVEECSEPKAVKQTISLQGLTEMYPCCKNGTECVCREGCLDKAGNLRAVGEEWDEEGENSCGKSLTKKKCLEPSSFPDPQPECPQEVLVPCEEPTTCGNCLNRTSYIDEYCCEIASCDPLNDPIQCTEPGENQRISTIETGDECFPSKECCVCDTTCSYKGARYQLFQVWQDEESCTRMRCVLPESTLRTLGFEGDIDFKDLENQQMNAKFEEMKAAVDYRTMMSSSDVPKSLYEQCQQDVSLCPKAIDIGCKPVDECPECHTTNITQDNCGCDVSTCNLIERCDSYVECPTHYRQKEVEGADPCKAPCYECVCDHVCSDNFDGRAYQPGTTWQRKYVNPVRKCETCNCTTDRDQEDGCLKEVCAPTPCPPVEECQEPYNKANYDEDECGCTVLTSCECTQCMLNGEVVPGRSSGESWTVGDVDLGCYDTYVCDLVKDDGKKLECFNVTKTRANCTVDPPCPEDYVAVKNEDRSCCYDGTCCPRYDCDCVKCRFQGQSYSPGETWTQDCIVYTCTNITDEADPNKCYLVTNEQYPCEDIKPECDECRVETLLIERKVPDQCCNVWGCKEEKVCIKDDGTRVPTGYKWDIEPCKRVLCNVSDEDWAAKKCPAWVETDHCDEDTTVCGECTNRTVVKDECGCDKIECPPNNPPTQCTNPAENQVIEFFNNDDTCSAGKNCCVCDSGCYYKGARYDLLTVWMDQEACQRMRCVLPEATLGQLQVDPATVDYTVLEDYATWRKIQSSLNYGKILRDTGVHNRLYESCSQETSLCPVAREIGCPEVQKCDPCFDTTESVDGCGCPVVTCSPYVCPPAGFDNPECTEPKSLLVNVTLLGRSERYPCCTWGYECQCQDGCKDSEGNIRAIGEVWDEEGTNECGKTLTKKRCIRSTGETEDECPQTVDVPCETPVTCAKCQNRTSYIDDYCCEIASCKPLDEPQVCKNPAENQRISSLETGDECFPSKNCCVCDTTCNYNGATYQLFEVWEDTKACTRSRCILPEQTIRALGYEGDIDYKDLKNEEMTAIFTDLKSRIDYRKMMTDTKVNQRLYDQCQQDVSLCPAVYDMGCEPVEECPECSNTAIVQDECGCDVSTCVAILPCAPIVCLQPWIKTEIEDVDPCLKPCYECTCNHTCVDDVTKATYEPKETWNRTILEPRSCETCKCTTDRDEEDGCLKEACEPIPCPAVDECTPPYDKAVYGMDDCGCIVLISCECTKCMYNGEILQNRTAGETWYVGDLDRGCFDKYTCEAYKKSDMGLECYEVTKQRQECTVDQECPENHVPVKDEDRSCCFEDGETCCPRYTCECVKCRFGEETYSPGDKWSKDCVDYTCTNVTDPADPKKCKLVDSSPSPCPEKETDCKDCYVETLTTTRNVPAGDCCNIYECIPEKVCVKEDGSRVPNGTIWTPDKCTRLQCTVSEEDWNKGVCPQSTPINPCINDLTVPCPPCTNKTIVKDECDCDSVSCPPINKAVECTAPAPYQVLTTLETFDTCQPAKNCCICDNTCMYKGVKKELFSVWIDDETCTRMRCLPSETLLTRLGYDQSAINFADLENNDLWNEMRSRIDFRRLISESGIATKVYEECSQDASLCPTAKSIGCQIPEPCPNCTTTVNTEDSCGCPIRTCVPFKCPPVPYDVKECSKPKSKLVEISLKDLSDKYPCCPVGQDCVCEDTCFDNLNNPRAIGEEWDEPSEYQCSSDPTSTGSIIKKRCNPPATAGSEPTVERRSAPSLEAALSLLSKTEDDTVCPYTTVVPCEDPDTCGPCEEAVTTSDERCCLVVTCKKIECPVNTLADCVLPKIAMRSDAEVTGDECCPKYCDCPYQCTETETSEKYDRNAVWQHPLDSCYTRTCLVDGALNQGCPYITNSSICTEPNECEVCYSAEDTVDSCGCTSRKCNRNPCPKLTCDDECDEVYETGDLDDCGCPFLDCRPKPCPAVSIVCDDPEKNVYSWMDLKVDKCCKQHGCRCNYTKCEEPKCPPGQMAVRNVSAVKCCCPEYTCVPNVESECVDYSGIPRKVNVPWINKDNKCKMLQCTPSAKSTTYRIEEFDRFTCSNERPFCSNGGTPYLASTKEGCCNEWVCPCTCQVYGDPHFTTFDGKSYEYQGKCTYTLMKEYRFNQTEIIIDNELCRWQSARTKSLSCLKTMTVLHKGVNYTFTFGLKFLRNGQEYRARPQWVSDDGDVTIREYGYKQLKLQVASIGLDITYKTREWMQSLIVTIPYESLEGKMLGLCGTCNNDATDEYRDRNMNLVPVSDEHDYAMIDKFGESWIRNVKDYDEPNCFPVEPECPEETEFPYCGELPPDECISCDNKCHLSHPKCHPCDVDPCQVLRTNEVFQQANLRVDPRVYQAKCAYDLSLESNTSRKCNPCFSASVNQYASFIELKGMCVPWRSALGCPDFACPANQEYRACDLDARRDLSCELPVLNITGSVNVEGCFCPEGTIRRSSVSEECIPLKCCGGCSEPPTCEDGSVALAGEKTDDCGCPIYMCSDIKGCEVQTTTQVLEIDIAGRTCISPEKVVSSGCAGNCAATTTSVNGDVEATCSKCNPTDKTSRTVTLNCADGTSEEYEYEVIAGCECASFPCGTQCEPAPAGVAPET